ncbi:MAG: BatA domain-containing protein, partial [Myxococcota bacterium]
MISGFRFAYPWVFLAIPALLLLWLWRRRTEAITPRIRYSSVHGLSTAPTSWRQHIRRVLLPGLRWLSLGLGILVVARPQHVVRRQWYESKGIDIVVSMDTSGSMNIIDMYPRRGLVSNMRQRLTRQGFYNFATARTDTLDRLD